MSKAQLKKTLSGMDTKEISEMILELYDARPEAKEYLEYWLDPNPQNELERYKEKVKKLFFTPTEKPKKSPTLTSIKNILKYFSTLCYDDEMQTELRIYIAETYVKWLVNIKRPLRYIKTVTSNIESAEEYVEQRGLEERFSLKLIGLKGQIETLREKEELHKTPGFKRFGKYRRWF